VRSHLLVALLSFSFLVGSFKAANALHPTFMKAFLEASELSVEQHEQKPGCTHSAVKHKTRFGNEFDNVILPFCIGAFAIVFVPYIIYHDLRPYMKRLLGQMNPMPAPHAVPPFVPNDALRHELKYGG